MKRVRVLFVAIGILVLMAGVSQAQISKDYVGDTRFNMVVTEEQGPDNGTTKLVTKTGRFSGEITINLLQDELDPSMVIPNSISIVGVLDNETDISIACTNMAGVKAESDHSKKTGNDKVFLNAYCSLVADAGATTGIALLNLAGTFEYPKGSTDAFPNSIRLTGSKLSGGAQGLVLKATFSSLLAEPEPEL